MKFYDTLSWAWTRRPDTTWSGFHNLAKQVCPFGANWLATTLRTAAADPQGTFKKLFSECQAYGDALEAAGVMQNGALSTQNPIPK